MITAQFAWMLFWSHSDPLLVAVSQSAQLLLSRRVPHVEADLPVVRIEDHRVDLDADRGDVPSLELARDVALDEGSLADASISDED